MYIQSLSILTLHWIVIRVARLSPHLIILPLLYLISLIPFSLPIPTLIQKKCDNYKSNFSVHFKRAQPSIFIWWSRDSFGNLFVSCFYYFFEQENNCMTSTHVDSIMIKKYILIYILEQIKNICKQTKKKKQKTCLCWFQIIRFLNKIWNQKQEIEILPNRYWISRSFPPYKSFR